MRFSLLRCVARLQTAVSSCLRFYHPIIFLLAFAINLSRRFFSFLFFFFDPHSSAYPAHEGYDWSLTPCGSARLVVGGPSPLDPLFISVPWLQPPYIFSSTSTLLESGLHIPARRPLQRSVSLFPIMTWLLPVGFPPPPQPPPSPPQRSLA